MLKKKKYLFIYLCITLVFSLASAIMQTLMWRYIEPETELYVAGSAVPKIINWILAAMVLILLSSAFVFRKEKIKPMIAVNQLSVFSSSLCGFFFLASVVLEIYNFIVKQNKGTALEEAFLIIAVILSFPCAWYFFTNAISSRKNRILFSYLSLSPILWSISYLISSYFSMSTTMNSPLRVLEQLMVLCVMIFFLCEAKVTAKKGSYGNLYICFALVSILMISAVAIPRIILATYWLIELKSSLIYFVLQISILLYILSKMLHLLFGKDDQNL